MAKRKKEEFIIIIDDESQVLKALQRELIDYMNEEGITLLSFTSVQACLEELEHRASSVSVIISDLRMPEMKGSDFLSKVHELYPEIELMLLTAYNDIPDIQKAVSATIRALILKPWDPDLLISEIEKARTIFQIRTENKEHLQQIKKQLEIAGEFQQKLLETEIPRFPDIDIELSYIPLPRMKIGGDYYDFIEIDDHRFFILIGDVTGHGVKPSFVTAMLKVLTLSFTRRSRLRNLTPSTFLAALNTQLCQALKNTTDVLITFSCLLIDTKKRLLTYANAGHLPVFVIHSHTCTTHHIDGPAMGFSPGLQYNQQEVQLYEGDIVSIYTDGLLESEVEQSKISDEVIKRFLLQAEDDKSFNDSFIKQLKLVRQIEEFHDDITLITVKI